MNLEQAIESIQSMGVDERRRMVYEMAVGSSMDAENEFIRFFYQWMEDNQIGTCSATGTAKLEELISIIRVSTALLDAVTSKQARRELQHVSENSEYGMRLADAMNSAVLEMKRIADNTATLINHYSAVLEGRRQDIHFTDDEGTAVAFSDKEKLLMKEQRSQIDFGSEE